MTDEKYNGWANKETWAFNLHWQNDEGLYRMVLDDMRMWVTMERVAGHTGPIDPTRLGEVVVAHMQVWLDEGEVFPLGTERMLRREIGSFWRVDLKETGDAVLESFAGDPLIEAH